MTDTDDPDFRPQLRQIIAHLGAEWTAHPAGNPEEPNSPYNRTHLYAHNGPMKLILYHTGETVWPKSERNRLKVSALYPSYPCGTSATAPGDHISITVSLTKPPRTVAQEIQRRLLPHYAARIEEVTQRVRAETLKVNRKKALEEMIAAAIGMPLVDYSFNRKKVEITPYRPGTPQGTITVALDGTSEIHLKDIDPETAIEIAKIVQQAHRWQAQTVKKPG